MLEPGARRKVEERLKTKWSKHAFNCAKCPEAGCPKWWTMELHDPVDGTTELTGCSDVLQQVYLAMSIGAGLEAVKVSAAGANHVVGAVRQLAQLEGQRELKVISGD